MTKLTDAELAGQMAYLKAHNPDEWRTQKPLFDTISALTAELVQARAELQRWEDDARLAEIVNHYVIGEKRTIYPGQAADDIRHLLDLMGFKALKTVENRQKSPSFTHDGVTWNGVIDEAATAEWDAWAKKAAAQHLLDIASGQEVPFVTADDINAMFGPEMDARPEADVRASERSAVIQQLWSSGCVINHMSSCAIYNAPALPAKQCNCGAEKARNKVKAEALREMMEKINAASYDFYTDTGNCDTADGYQRAADLCRDEANRLDPKLEKQDGQT